MRRASNTSFTSTILEGASNRGRASNMGGASIMGRGLAEVNKIMTYKMQWMRTLNQD
jgi:hypothetical protein